jgi:hypothetical protein
MTVAVAAPPATRTSGLAIGFAGCAALTLAVALRAPLATMVLGLILFGVLHNVLELRYVAGRFAGVLRGQLLWTLVALVSGIVLCRLLGLRTPEILLAYAVLLAGARHALPTWWFWPAAGGLAVAAAASLAWPAYHFVILTHLHNVVPLFFLWEWSRRLAGAAAVLGVLFLADYAQGRTVYQAFASYHAYLEFPVLLALLFSRRRGRFPPGTPPS